MKIVYEFDTSKEHDVDEHRIFSNADKYRMALLEFDLRVQKSKYNEEPLYYEGLKRFFYDIMEYANLDVERDL